MLEEVLSCELILLNALLSKLLYHLSFRSNRGVVSARHPASVVTRYASTTDEYVLDRVIEHMPHMQYARHVGRWHNDRVGLLAVIHMCLKELVV